MNWFKKRPPIQTTEPYSFEPGKHYVIEVDTRITPIKSAEFLSQWFRLHNIDVAIVLKEGQGKALTPVEATTTTNVDPDRSKMTPPKEQDQ